MHHSGWDAQDVSIRSTERLDAAGAAARWAARATDQQRRRRQSDRPPEGRLIRRRDPLARPRRRVAPDLNVDAWFHHRRTPPVAASQRSKARTTTTVDRPTSPRIARRYRALAGPDAVRSALWGGRSRRRRCRRPVKGASRVTVHGSCDLSPSNGRVGLSVERGRVSKTRLAGCTRVSRH